MDQVVRMRQNELFICRGVQQSGFLWQEIPFVKRLPGQAIFNQLDSPQSHIYNSF